MIYYLQPVAQSLRRYPDERTEDGERWLSKERKWTQECAKQRSCVLTKDRVIHEIEAQHVIGERL